MEAHQQNVTTVLFFGALLLFSCDLLGDETPPNPYGVAGWGVLDDLGMPAGCLDYDWNGLHTGTLCQMCRPNHYYNYVGIPVRWWGYDEQTGQINDPVGFDQWVTDNPGKIWIIGNEPDLGSQDGLTKEQYAHMYKTYYDFISQRDPTARFCIGAITGGSTTDRLAYTTGWYQDVLNLYETAYGQPMHIDIWNVHSYCGPTQIEDPDQPIRDFVEPFIDWCHTVDGNRYAGAEVWITELPIGEWMGALSEEWIIWFAQRYLPRLEQTGINRWFWFVSRDSGEWATVALVKANGVSPLGQAYADLANGYPNPAPPVSPYVPDPTPAYFGDDFSSGAISHPWMVKAGRWAVEAETLRQSRVDFPWNGETCALQYIYGDFDVNLQMRVNNATDPNHWIGFLFHMGGRFHSQGHSGYLVYLRQNGAIGLWNQHDGTMQEISAAVADASEFQRIRIQMAGWHIRVWANDNLIIDRTDANQRFGSGYTIFQVHKTDSRYDDVHIWNQPDISPEIAHAAINRTWLIADDATPCEATVTASDDDGVNDIADVRVTLDDGTFESDHARGQLAWGVSDAEIASQGGDWTFMGDVTGGGRWAWRLNDWGSDTYITPLSASTSTDGNQRSVTFAFAVKPAWAPAVQQKLHAYARDLKRDNTAWLPGPARYSIHLSSPGDLDHDRDSDQSDFGVFQACYSGPGIAQGDPACIDALLDSDDDVDQNDFTIFQDCMSGANVAADPACAS